MQNHLERRVVALESLGLAFEPKAIRWLDGESQDDALRRHGLPLDAENVLFIQRVIVEVPNGQS